MQTPDFYSQHLKEVSRSFAFCIAQLDGEFKHQVGLSYLILRVLDTIEDAPWESSADQQISFLQFNKFIDEIEACDQELWQKWVEQFPSEIPSGEKSLLLDSYFLFQDLMDTSRPARELIQNSVLNMSRGMMHFQSRKGTGHALQLKSLSELNGYCFFVAGVVGELLTDLLKLRSQNFQSNGGVYSSAVQFGLFLQKINILKDQAQDESEGRRLIHSRTEVFASLRQDVSGAFDYLKSIPKNEKGFRLFCAWSLFIGLESVGWIQKSWAMRIFNKIPREFTQGLMKEIESIISDDEALQKRFIKLKNALPLEKTPNLKPKENWISSEKFNSLYVGRLSRQQLLGVGIAMGSEA
jgi:phytoene/squalene synthetase